MDNNNEDDDGNKHGQTVSSGQTDKIAAKSDNDLDEYKDDNSNGNERDDVDGGDDVKETLVAAIGYETDDDDDNNNNNDPEHQAEDFVPVDKFDKVPFHELCKRLEAIWRNKKGGKGKSTKFRQKSYKLSVLMPEKMMDSLKRDNGTPFQWIRLIVPENDTSRQFKMKQKTITRMYCDSFALVDKKEKMLMNYTDPLVVPADRVGDLSLVAELILQSKLPTDKHSNVSVSEINEYLDQLASIRMAGFKAHYNHDWWKDARSQSFPEHSQQSQSQSQSRAKSNQTTGKSDRHIDRDLRRLWLDKIRERGLSPLEHKWLIRIILGDKMDIGVGVVALLEWYSPYGKGLWNASNNLQKVCNKLSNPAFVDEMARSEELKKEQDAGRASLWEPQVQPAELGSKVTPMVSMRTYFDRLMTQTQAKHREYLERFYEPEHNSKYKPLSLLFPALSVEIKLDGERMIVHMTNGRVKMNSRNGTWYSELYTPVLGPSLRAATRRYPNINLMLDGEVESWDDENQVLVPFGENRRVAQLRREYLAKKKMIEDIDKDLHKGDTDSKIMRVANEKPLNKSPENFTQDAEAEKVRRGKNMWLKIMLFDILFVDGPDARRLLDDCGHKKVRLGSIINLPLLNRKQILHQLISEQENNVELCPSIVLRPNGRSESPQEYYACTDPMMEFGHVASFLDSTSATIDGLIPNLEAVDFERMQGKKEAEVSMMRSREVDRFYKTVVEDYKFEGLVVKDLASPYRFGDRQYWWKFKPDYEKDDVHDIDVVILGCSFACGRRLGGSPSSFLVGVLDSKDTNPSPDTAFMTLCTINAASAKFDMRDAIWRRTGFQRGGTSRDLDLGSWYYPENEWELPEFISKRSLQNRGIEDNNGWKFDKSLTYPDLWIKPQESLVLTIKGAELVQSDEHSCGVTLRFPRITKVRIAEAKSDEKSVWEVETDADVWKAYSINSREKKHSINSSSQSYSQFYDMSSSAYADDAPHRFLTPEELRRQNRKKKAAVVMQQARAVPTVAEPETNALDGLTFVVLEGNYAINRGSFEEKIGRENGWYDLAIKVRNEADVIQFIKTHGGEYRSVPTYHEHEFLIGGEKDDARVPTMIEGLRKIRQVGRSVREKRAQENCKHIDGIIKWTYIFDLVFRWKEILKQKKDLTTNEKGNGNTDEIEDVEDDSLLSLQDPGLIPGPEHYLMKASTEMTLEQELFNLDRPLKLYEMERVTDTPSVDYVGVPWQYRAMKELDEEDRWIMSTTQTKLWPYTRRRDEDVSVDVPHKPVILYPDVFRVGFGLDSAEESTLEVLANKRSLRWENISTGSKSCDEILSVLPLARAMGALETPHLHNGVTHIICNLKDSRMPIELNFPIDTDTEKLAHLLFKEKNRGRVLLERLKSVVPDKETITLCPPSWIVEKWDK